MLDPGSWIIAFHRKWDADFADGHGFHRIPSRPQITQIDTDDIAPSQGCIAKNTKIDRRKAHKDIASQSKMGDG